LATFLKVEVSTCEEAIDALVANPAQDEHTRNILQACEKLEIPCAEDTLDRHLTTIAVPYMQEVLSNIPSRFEQTSHLLEAMCIFNPKLIPCPASSPDTLANYGNQQLDTLLDFYGKDTTVSIKLPGEEEQSATVLPNVDPQDTRVEWRAFKKLLCSNYEELSAQDLLQDLTKSEMGSAFYPNLNKTPHHFSVLACVYSDF
jgi:hypothetical protein